MSFSEPSASDPWWWPVMAERRIARQGAAGFTLLELLVVLLVFSMIVVALTSGVQLASRAWSRQEQIIDREGDVSVVQRQVRQLVAAGTSFKGDAYALRFVGSLPSALREPGLFDIVLTTSGDRLVIDWNRHVPVDPTAELPPEQEHAVLLDHVSDLALTYYYRGDLGGPGEWRDSIDAKSVPPALIGIAVAFRTQTGRRWPRLVVAPRIEPPSVMKP